jgi:hypothetical protein
MLACEVRLDGVRLAEVRLGARVFPVRQTLEHWRAGRRWWRGEWPHEYYRLETSDGLLLEVFAEGVLSWTLAALQD